MQVLPRRAEMPGQADPPRERCHGHGSAGRDPYRSDGHVVPPRMQARTEVCAVASPEPGGLDQPAVCSERHIDVGRALVGIAHGIAEQAQQRHSEREPDEEPRQHGGPGSAYRLADHRGVVLPGTDLGDDLNGIVPDTVDGELSSPGSAAYELRDLTWNPRREPASQTNWAVIVVQRFRDPSP